MEKITEIVGNLPVYLGAITGVLVALGALFALIPGDQPEKTLYKIADFTKKFSKK